MANASGIFLFSSIQGIKKGYEEVTESTSTPKCRNLSSPTIHRCAVCFSLMRASCIRGGSDSLGFRCSVLWSSTRNPRAGGFPLEGKKGREPLDECILSKLKLFRIKHYQLTLVLIYSSPSILIKFLILTPDLIYLIHIIFNKYLVNIFWVKHYEIFEEDTGANYLHCADKDTVREILGSRRVRGGTERRVPCSTEPRASPESHLVPSIPLPESLKSKRNTMGATYVI